MSYYHDPYKFQVCTPDDFVVVVVNGRLMGTISKTTSLYVSMCGNAHVVCYTPTKLEDPNVRVKLKRVENKDVDLGCLRETDVISCTIEISSDCSFYIEEEESDTDEKKVLSTVVGVFHDEKINPSFGALRINDLKTAIEAQIYLKHDLASLLQKKSDFFHCYQGKDDEIWVVLHSHCKKVVVDQDNSSSYANLLKKLVDELSTEEQSLADLFRSVSTSGAFNSLLASNFTILKKFLIKYNAHFAWFQDEKSKTTKVVLY